MGTSSVQVVAAVAASRCREQTGPCAFSDRWADFYANYVAPARDVAVPALCVFFAILVLARLVPLAMPVGVGKVLSWGPAPATSRGAPDAWSDPGSWPRRRRRAGLSLGVVLALAAASSVALWLPDIGPRSVRWWAILLTVLAGVAAALLIGLWLGSRLRLTIDATAVDGSKSPAAAAHVAARVGELGGSTPGGLELARGTDTSALLGSALTDVPEGRLAQLAVRILQGALGTSPWRADVDQFDATTVSVVVTRNGRQAGSAVIDRDLLFAEAGLTDSAQDQIDIHRFVAAVVVTTLARFHPREFLGLCGASDWRSLGFYYLGSTRYDSPDYYDAQKRVFARAVELDRNNWLAQLGFRRAVDRRSTDPDVLARYRRWLRRLADPDGVLARAGFEALRLRAHYTCLSLSINGMFAREARPSADGGVGDCDDDDGNGGGGGDGATSWDDAFDDATDLFRAIELVDRNGSNAKLAQDLAVTGAPLALTVLGRRTTTPRDDATNDLRKHLGPYLRHLDGAPLHERPDPTSALSTKALYNTGCYYGCEPGLDEERALRCLRLAVEDDRFRRWALDDPQLAALRQREAFWSALGYRPRTELLELAILAPFADRLRRAGLTTAREIARCTVDELVEQTGARPAEAATVRDVAGLRVAVPDGLDRVGTEILDELVSRGCARAGALGRLDAPARTALATGVVVALGRRLYLSADDAASLADWLSVSPRTPSAP